MAQAKAILLGRLESDWDDAEGIAAAWMRAIVLGRQRPRPDGERAGIERVGAEEIRALARTLLDGSRLRWIVSGDARAASRAVDAGRLGRLRALKLEQ